MKSLTKENFWNELYSKYPKGVQVFCDWIDEYKKRVDWNRLFNDGVREHQFVKGPPKFTKAPKFHDLPIAMQIGIWNEFCQEMVAIGKQPIYDWPADISETCKRMHEVLIGKESKPTDQI